MMHKSTNPTRNAIQERRTSASIRKITKLINLSECWRGNHSMDAVKSRQVHGFYWTKTSSWARGEGGEWCGSPVRQSQSDGKISIVNNKKKKSALNKF